MARNLWQDIQGVARAEVDFNKISNPSRFLHLVLMIREILRAIRNDNAFTLATALAYKTLVALIPLLAISLAIVSLLETDSAAGTYTDSLIQVIHDRLPEFPGKEQFVFVVQDFAGKAKAIAGIGTIFLFAIAFSLISSVEKAFNQIWHVTEKRPFLSKLGAFLSTLVIVPVLLSISVYFSAHLATLTEGVVFRLPLGEAVVDSGAPIPSAAVEPVSPGENGREVETRGAWFTTVILAVSSVVVTIAAMSALIFLLPFTPVRLGSALAGGAVAGVLFEVAKYLFHYYALWVGSNYREIYGPLSAFPVILFWLWVVWVILLIGAELAFVSQNYADLAVRAEIERRGIDSRIYLAVRIVLESSQNFSCGREQECLSEVVAERLRVPPYTVRQIVNHLVDKGILRPIADKKEMYLPARDIHRLTVNDVVLAMQADRLSVPLSPDDSTRRMISSLFSDAEETFGSILHQQTFAGLVRLHECSIDNQDGCNGGESVQGHLPPHSVRPDRHEGEVLLADRTWSSTEGESPDGFESVCVKKEKPCV